MKGTVLLTGGAGYIGSHTYVALVEAGYRAVIVDNFANAHRSVIDRLARITGAPVPCEEADVLDEARLREVLTGYGIESVIHFAAKKAVGESVEIPLDYVRNNVCGFVSLVGAMAATGVFRLVFSSSATVYGDTETLPIPETCERRYINPYGYTKLACEQIIEQMAYADPRWRVGVLRYFNPVGAHPSGLIGDDPIAAPANLMPLIARVALGRMDEVRIFGGDFPTPDGTGVRDFVHVSDLAEGHVLSLAALYASGQGHVVNLGTGQGHSVLEVIRAYARACGREIPHRICGRRPGDAPASCADVTRARELLGFRATRDLDEMCRSSWKHARTAMAHA